MRSGSPNNFDGGAVPCIFVRHGVFCGRAIIIENSCHNLAWLDYYVRWL